MSRVRSASNLRRALEAIDVSATRHVRARANELSGIAKDLHRTAPRGGENINRFGEPRSAPGEVPAMETGGLFAEIDQGIDVKLKEATVIVNRTTLEFGTPYIRPRPLGRRASETFKGRIR